MSDTVQITYAEKIRLECRSFLEPFHYTIDKFNEYFGQLVLVGVCFYDSTYWKFIWPLLILGTIVFAFLKFVYYEDEQTDDDDDYYDADDTAYPPINRVGVTLEENVVVILDDTRTPLEFYMTLPDEDENEDKGIIDRISPKNFYFPFFVGLQSDISELPAFYVHTENVKIALTNDEAYRYLNKLLYPDEYFIIRDKFGMHLLISELYYDEDGERS